MITRARGGIAVGALGTAVAAVGTAAAQQPAPAPAPAPAFSAVAAPKAASTLRVTKKRLNVRAGRTALVSGSLRPARAGRVVTLEKRTGRGWRTIDKARTSRTGRYALRYKTRS